MRVCVRVGFASACRMHMYPSSSSYARALALLCVYECAAASCLPHTHARAQGGKTALMRAASIGRADCVRLLLDAGADKEARNDVRVFVCRVCVVGRAHFGVLRRSEHTACSIVKISIYILY